MDSLLVTALIRDGVKVIVVTQVANCPSSIRDFAKTDLPQPGPAETQSRLDDLTSRQLQNLLSVRNYSQVLSTLCGLRFLDLA